jgi:hypothetical protein
MLNATNAVLCWTPNTSLVALLPWPDRDGLSQAYQFRDLACWAFVHDLTRDQRRGLVLALALELILRFKCPAHAVHGALMGLEEYVGALAEYACRPMPSSEPPRVENPADFFAARRG